MIGETAPATRRLSAIHQRYARKLPHKAARLRVLVAMLCGTEQDTVLLRFARGEAHQLKGTAGAYGFMAVSRWAAQVDEQLALLAGPAAGLAGPAAGLAGPAAGLAGPAAGLAGPAAGLAGPAEFDWSLLAYLVDGLLHAAKVQCEECLGQPAVSLPAADIEAAGPGLRERG